MAAQDIAQGLASYGRNGDSMLVHMQPREVAGLQSLAMAQGGSLSINPVTGLPEANFLGDLFESVAPIAVGGLLSMVPGMSPLAAGLLTGAATWAITGDPLKGVMGGLGASGGFGLGKDLAKFGGVKSISTTPLMGEAADDVLLQSSPFTTARDITANATDDILGAQQNFLQAQTQAPTFAESFEGVSKGAQRAMSSPFEFLKQSESPVQNIATLASPLLTAGAQAPMQTFGTVPPTGFDYKGPYQPLEREVRTPTAQQQQQLAMAGSPEFQYFSPTNPYPGYRNAFADGGQIQAGGIRDLYGTSDDQTNGAVLSRDGYGLGRLNSMYGATQTPMPAFANGGQIPMMGGPAEVPATSGILGLQGMLQNAITNPMGKTMAKGGYLDGPGDGMSDSIPASIEGKQPARLADGEFVIPADVVSHLGNGSSKAGAKHLYKMMEKVRKARTGNKKQGRKINPGKFVPA